MSKGTHKNARHIKIQWNGSFWTIYRDKRFVAKGIDQGGETVIEESDGSMKEDAIYLLIEDVLNN